MLKPILLSAFTVLSFGFVAASPLSENHRFTQFVFQSQSELDESSFEHYAQNKTEESPDVSRGDTRRSS